MTPDVTLDSSRPGEDEMLLLKNIYLTSFPPDERRPWEDVVCPGDNPQLLTVRADGGCAVGLLTYWDFGNVVYIEHFAVTAEMRSKGLGEMALQSFITSVAPRPVVLEAEPPAADNPFAVRRLEFYLRNGFDILTRDYIQPPYTATSKPVPLYLLSTAPDVSASNLIATLYHRVYSIL